VIGAPEDEELRKRSSFISRQPSGERPFDAARDQSINATNDMHLMKRGLVQTDKWFLSMMSMPEGLPFDKDISFTDKNTGDHLPTIDKYSHGFEDNLGLGQTIYIMDTFWRGKGQTVRLFRILPFYPIQNADKGLAGHCERQPQGAPSSGWVVG
jgi:hypothetical protein